MFSREECLTKMRPHAAAHPYRQLGTATRRGQALIEFAVVALVVYMLLAAILTFGHALYVAQGLQTAADLAAREVSRTPLPAQSTFEEALADDDVRSRIFDEAFLVVDLEAFYSGDPTADFFQDAVPQMPLLNQQLATLMIVDRPDFDGNGTADAWLLRYPGALLQRSAGIAPPTSFTYPDWVSTQYAVGIPVVTNRAAGGFESIRWVPVVEEIDTEATPDDDTAPNPDPFQLVQGDAEVDHRGIVALRINFPFQSASMSSFRPNDAGAFDPTIGFPNAADDGEVTEVNPAARPGNLISAPLTSGENYSGTYGGSYGLGAQGALGSELLTGGRPVRPYRRVISAQAIYRREVIGD